MRTNPMGAVFVRISLLVAILALVGCSGLGDQYSEADIRRDAFQLVPPEATDVHVLVRKGDGFNPTMAASVNFTVLHRTERQRIAEYKRIALAHGWELKAHSIENAHAYLVIRTNFGFPDGNDLLTLVMK